MKTKVSTLIGALVGGAALAVAAAASAAPAAGGAPNPALSGYWQDPYWNSRRDGGPIPEGGRPRPPEMPLTAWAAGVRDEYMKVSTKPDYPVYEEVTAKCQPEALFGLGGGGPTPVDIVQREGQVVVMAEGWRLLPRRIYTDGRGHPAPDKLQRTPNGHSIGRWENGELLVDTIGFDPEIYLDRMRHVPQGELLHITERFALEDGGKTLVHEMVMEDPKTFTQPYKVVSRRMRVKDTSVEPVCVVDFEGAEGWDTRNAAARN